MPAWEAYKWKYIPASQSENVWLCAGFVLKLKPVIIKASQESVIWLKTRKLIDGLQMHLKRLDIERQTDILN